MRVPRRRCLRYARSALSVGVTLAVALLAGACRFRDRPRDAALQRHQRAARGACAKAATAAPFSMRSLMRLFVAAASILTVSACAHDATSPGSGTGPGTGPGSPPSGPGVVPGAWTATTSFYSAVRLRMTERPDDHVLVGNWAGDVAGCTGAACTDSGSVVAGTRAGSTMTFLLSAIDAARSLSVAGVIAADSSISGTAELTDNGTRFPADSVRFRRH